MAIAKPLRIRDLGYAPGMLETGPTNSILDIPGVHISQVTVPTLPNLPGDSTATKGVTVITPRAPQDFYKPCAASSFTFNGNGELTGSRQIADWGFVNTPIAFTNSLSLGTVFDGVWDWILDQQDALKWDLRTRSRHYGTPVVGETADWLINSNVRSSRLEKDAISHCLNMLKNAEQGAAVLEGQFGGGAGMTCHQYCGGTGTASRKLGGGEGSSREYTLGVLVQSNYGHLVDFVVGGVPIGKILKKEKDSHTSEPEQEQGVDVRAPEDVKAQDGSILVLVITDAPLATHQLNRLARHATVGLGQVGSRGIGRTFSGDIFLALSTAECGPQQLDENTTMRYLNPSQFYQSQVLKNESIDPHFVACAEAVEEAILNSIMGGVDGKIGLDGTKVDGMPVGKVRELLKKHLVQV